ncbi:MAG: TA system VapC family ribonuclease toxin [Pseudomonadota bacterium]
MKLVDTNVLLYAVNADSAQHPVAHAWLRDALVAPRGLGLAWQSLLGFVRLSTRSGILPSPLAVTDALGVLNRWLAAPAARVVHPTEQHAALVGRLLRGAGTGGNLVGDAHLAALALEHGATVVSFDRDFARFAGVALELLAA